MIKELPYEMTFDDLLKDAIRDYYDRFGKRHPADFAALLVAIGGMRTASVAWDSIREGELPKKVAYGAMGMVALRYGLRYVLSGPLGILATGLTVAGLARYVLTNQALIRPKAQRFREVIEGARARYSGLTEGLNSGRLTSEEREMIAEGLRSRLVQALIGAQAAA